MSEPCSFVNGLTVSLRTILLAEIVKAKAETEFEKYRVVQDRLFMSDFDRYMLELEENTKKYRKDGRQSE